MKALIKQLGDRRTSQGATAKLKAMGAALAEVEEARRLLGPAFVAWDALARCRLAGGKAEEGLAALAEALEWGMPVSQARDILLSVGIPSARRDEFWGRRLATAKGDPELRLEVARAAVDAGRATEVIPVLRELAEVPSTAAEASYLTARAFLAAGGEAIARKYARRAADAVPDEPRYSALVEELGEEEK